MAEPMPPSAIGCSMFNRSQTAVLIMIFTPQRKERLRSIFEFVLSLKRGTKMTAPARTEPVL